MSIFDTLTSLFAPHQCISCRREGALICDYCIAAFALPPGICFSCYQTTPQVMCVSCLTRSKLTSVSSATHYEGLAKQLVASLKFTGNQSAARVMAQRIATSSPPPPPDALLVHMPATTKHIRERGYDQAALISKHLSRIWDISHMSLLSRHGDKHQLGAGRQERLVQLKAALRVKTARDIRGKTVVLIDDVLTTGSSVIAATDVLLAAGAARVDAVVFAQAVQREGL